MNEFVLKSFPNGARIQFKKNLNVVPTINNFSFKNKGSSEYRGKKLRSAHNEQCLKKWKMMTMTIRVREGS